jgi:type I site-specific restriction endonuclease
MNRLPSSFVTELVVNNLVVIFIYLMNQNTEQLARDQIDQLLLASGWLVESFKQKNIAAASGVAIREYPTDTVPADFILFVNKKPVGVIEAKREEEGVRLTVHEDQSSGYAAAKLKYIINNNLLAFERLEKVNSQPKNELITLVSLVGKLSGADIALTSLIKR